MCLLCHLYEILIPRTKDFLLCFLLNFMILALTFRSVISFELILYIAWSQHSFCPHRNIQLLQHHTLKNCSFSDRTALAYLSKANWQYICGSISGLSLSLFYTSIFMLTTLSWWLYFYRAVWRKEKEILQKEGRQEEGNFSGRNQC